MCSFCLDVLFSFLWRLKRDAEDPVMPLFRFDRRKTASHDCADTATARDWPRRSGASRVTRTALRVARQFFLAFAQVVAQVIAHSHLHPLRPIRRLRADTPAQSFRRSRYPRIGSCHHLVILVFPPLRLRRVFSATREYWHHRCIT